MKRLLIFFLALISFFTIDAQQKVLDSLYTVSKEQKGKPLVLTFNEISWHYRNIQVDSALLYARKALNEAKDENDKSLKASVYNSIASAHQAFGVYDSANYYHQKSLSINNLLGDSTAIANTFNNLGIVNDELGNFETSLQYYFKALKLYENQKKDSDLVPMVLSNIGIVYKKQGEYYKVLDYYQQALASYKKSNNLFGITVTTGNIGSVLLRLKKFNETITHSENALEGYKKLGYSRYIPYMLNNIAVAQDSLGDHINAEKTYKNAIRLFISDSNEYELTNTKIGFAKNQIQFNRFSIAISELNLALEKAKENKFKEFEVSALKLLSDAYSLDGDHVLAYQTLQEYILKKDEVYQLEKTKSILEIESKYQTEKKEKEIIKQRAEIDKNEAALELNNNLLIGAIALAFLLGLIGYLFYEKQRLKNEQLQKESELKNALVKIETQHQLQEQRLRISRDLHDNIGSQLTFISSSLDILKYGLKDTETKVKDKLTSLGLFTKTTINELRDTIWAMNKENITFEDLQTRISQFINTANQASEQIEFDFVVDSDIKIDYAFTAEEGINLYRIIQEAIHNALKYAFLDPEQNNKSIEVCIYKTFDFFHIQIKDNGIGFEVKEVAFGNGILNMKKRVVDLKSELIMQSKLDKGTKIKFSIPVKK
ncbi:MAG: tetratricopeptide repeat protein [Cellulophaga sp.]|nr:tetratricopeptide repeat protein [Cellulophaga sp.]